MIIKNTYKVNEEAVKKIAERVYDNGSTVINRNDLEEMFPELKKESEDERLGEEPASSYKPDAFEMALTEMIDKARKCVIEPWVVAAQWKDELLSLAKGEESVSKKQFAFKAIPRLLEMIEPTDRAKTYTTKLAEALEKEGYTIDAKIVRESIKIMNGDKVAMATMGEKSVSEDFEKEVEKMWAQESKCRDTDYTIAELTKQDYEDCARHFAKWQKEQDSKLPHIWQRDTLDEYAYQVAYDLSNDWAKDYADWKDVQNAVKLGAEWERNHIAKENMLLPFKEYDSLMDSINKKKKEGYESGFKQGLSDAKTTITTKEE